MKNIKQHIEDKTKVYSLEFGAGEIVSLLKVYDGIDDYFEVHFKKDNFYKLYSTNGHENIRLISNANTLSEALMGLSNKVNNSEFEFCHSSYSRMSTHFDIFYVTNVIAGLLNEKDLDDRERNLLSSYLGSLTLEVANVYETSLESAEVIIDDHLRLVS